MAIVNGYASLAEVKARIGEDAAETRDEAIIEQCVEAASRSLDQFCGRRFWADSNPVARYYRPREDDLAWVDDISTTTGLTVKVDTTADGTFDETWAINTDFELEPYNADAYDGSDTAPAYAWWRIAAIDDKRFTVTSTNRRTLEVTAAFGWTGVPHQIREATILQSVRLFRRKEAPFSIDGLTGFRIPSLDRDLEHLAMPLQRVRLESVGR